MGRRLATLLRKGDALTLFGSGIVLALYLALVLLWSGGAFEVEVLLGHPPLPPHLPEPGASFVDALWHLGTAFLLALPTRQRWAIALAPSLALGLDIDHLFGSIFPTVVTRQAHALLFVVLVGLALYAVRGRAAGGIASGAVLAHIGVDGGSFPLLAPFSTAFYPLNLGEQGVFLVVAAALFLLGVRTAREAASRRYALPFVAALASMGVLLALAWPYIEPFARG